MSETNKQALNALKGFLGAFREAVDMLAVFDTLQGLDDQVASLRNAKVSLGTEVADMNDQRKFLVEQVDGLSGKRDEALASLDEELKAKKATFEDEFSAKRESMTRTLENLTTLIGDAQMTHDALIERLRLEKEQAQARHDEALADLAALKAKFA